MKIILLKDIPKVGKKYEIKFVAEGYALNRLIPMGFAQVATPRAVQTLEILKANDMAEKKIQGELLMKNLDSIKSLTLNIKENANEKGHLFAGITKERISDEIVKAVRLNIDLDSIKLDKPIKEVGEHKVTIEVMGKKVELTVVVGTK